MTARECPEKKSRTVTTWTSVYCHHTGRASISKCLLSTLRVLGEMGWGAQHSTATTLVFRELSASKGRGQVQGSKRNAVQVLAWGAVGYKTPRELAGNFFRMVTPTLKPGEEL